MQSIFQGQSALDNTHPCFSRQPQIQGYGPLPFPPFQVPCQGKQLEDGFPQYYPVPNHMSSHDIHEADWALFISDVSNEGRLTGKQRVTASILPMTMHVGAAGFLISRAIQKKMKKGNLSKGTAKIDIWNYCFFNPRGVNITLYRGSRKLTGPTASTSTNYSSSSSSSSSSEDDSAYAGKNLGRESRRALREARREDRRHRKELRRQDKRERRERKKEQKQADRSSEPLFLLVESQNVQTQRN